MLSLCTVASLLSQRANWNRKAEESMGTCLIRNTKENLPSWENIIL